MKRYFVVNEFFGKRVYDSLTKKENYYSDEEFEKVKNDLEGNYNYIDNKRESQFSSPLKISMNLTKKCTLRCIQCFSDSGKCGDDELTTEEMYNLFDSMNRYGTFFICLGGGEPFTRKDLYKILEYGKQKQLAISIVSNSLLLTEDKLEKLNDMDLDYLWVSFEGLRENHDKLRGIGTFDKTIEKLKLIRDYYLGKKAIRMSINKNNISDIEQLLRIAEDYNFDLIRFTPLLSFGRAKQTDLTIDNSQYIEFLNKVKQLKSDSVEIVYPNKKTNKIWIGQNGFGCHCGKEAIWVDESGYVSPCIFWGEEYTVGNIRDESYMNLWEKSLQVSNIEGNETCTNCNNYNECRGGCRARSLFEYGNLDDVDPLCPKRLIKIKK